MWPYHSPFGGDEQNRTVDPLLAKQVLSQLSYTPISVFPQDLSDLPLLIFFFENISFSDYTL